MIETVKDLVDRLFMFPPDARVKFLAGTGTELEILSIYSENCSFRDGKPINTEKDKEVFIDLVDERK